MEVDFWRRNVVFDLLFVHSTRVRAIFAEYFRFDLAEATLNLTPANLPHSCWCLTSQFSAF